MIAEPTAPIEIFICYAREDEEYRQGLEKQLRILKRQSFITIWHDREIIPGTEWQSEIDRHLKSAQIILLLVSPDFMDSDYCYSIEMQSAMERHQRGEAHVIPIIVHHVYWQEAPFGKLQVLPTDARPITDHSWHSLNEAFYDVAVGIREVINKVREEQPRVAKLEQQRRAEEGRQVSQFLPPVVDSGAKKRTYDRPASTGCIFSAIGVIAFLIVAVAASQGWVYGVIASIFIIITITCIYLFLLNK